MLDTDLIKNVCPCDDCHNFEKCGKERIACRAFSSFVSENHFYTYTPRDPCKGTYNKIFENNDEQLLLKLLIKLKEENEDKTKGDKGE